ncbi:hypothetical protein B0T13DRAFT_228276 [Neurospora crassa]|nr:hypothetical protein B0T13DRAFT_228276 [Neurospora crassa]
MIHQLPSTPSATATARRHTYRITSQSTVPTPSADVPYTPYIEQGKQTSKPKHYCQYLIVSFLRVRVRFVVRNAKQGAKRPGCHYRRHRREPKRDATSKFLEQKKQHVLRRVDRSAGSDSRPLAHSSREMARQAESSTPTRVPELSQKPEAQQPPLGRKPTTKASNTNPWPAGYRRLSQYQTSKPKPHSSRRKLLYASIKMLRTVPLAQAYDFVHLALHTRRCGRACYG